MLEASEPLIPMALILFLCLGYPRHIQIHLRNIELFFFFQFSFGLFKISIHVRLIIFPSLRSCCSWTYTHPLENPRISLLFCFRIFLYVFELPIHMGLTPFLGFKHRLLVSFRIFSWENFPHIFGCLISFYSKENNSVSSF